MSRFKRRIWLPVACVYCYFALASSEPISMGIAIGTAFALSAGLSSYGYLKCKVYECCTDGWINLNSTNLKNDMKKRLYGQHLVINTVVRALKAHIKNDNPSKALVLSFHGWTGNGKNYVSEIIARHMYRKGKASQYVKLFLPDIHFPEGNLTKTLGLDLQAQIRATVSACPRSLFLFDEVDKVSADVISAIKPFIDYHKIVDNIDYSKSVFIFMSNTGGNDINQETYESWRKGMARSDIKLTDLEHVIMKAAFNENGGLKYSELIKHNLIDHFIPFLPLERSHVKLCVKDYLSSKNYHFNDKEAEENFLSKIVQSLQYFPKGTELFSTSGCKRIAQKVDLKMEEDIEQMEQQEAVDPL